MCYHAGSSTSVSISSSGRVSCLSKCLHTFTFFVPHTQKPLTLHTYPPHYECVAPFRNKLPGKFTREIPWQRQHGQRATRLKFCRPNPQPPAAALSMFRFENALNCCHTTSVRSFVPSTESSSQPGSQSVTWAGAGIASELQGSARCSIQSMCQWLIDWRLTHAVHPLLFFPAPSSSIMWFHLPYVTTV